MATKLVPVQQAAPTGLGTQNFTSTDFGTPNAAFFVITRATANNTATNGAGIGIGATDGSRQFSFVAHSQHNVTVSNTDSGCTSSYCITLLADDSTTVVAQAAFSAWCTDGITVNWTTVSSAFLVTCVLIQADHVYVDTGSLDVGNSVTPTLDWEPSWVFTAGSFFNWTYSNRADVMIGFADNQTPIVNRGLSFYSADGAIDPDDYALVDTAQCIQRQNGSIQEGGIAVTAFSSTGFTLSFNKTGSPTLYYGYLAVDVGNQGHWLGTVDAPTATGDWTITDPQFKPAFGCLIPNFLTAVDTIQSAGDGGSFGISFFTEDAEYTAGYQDEDYSSGVSDTQNLVDSKAINLPWDDGVAKYVATLSSFNSDGWTLNFTYCNPTTARKWIALAIEEGGETHQGAVDLTGYGTLSATGRLIARSSVDLRGTATLSGYPIFELKEDRFLTSLFWGFAEDFPNILSTYRGNPFSTPKVPSHRPMEEIFRYWSKSLIESIAGNVEGIASPQGSATHDDPGTIIPNPYHVAYSTVATAISAAKTSVKTTLGWTGPLGPTFLDRIVEDSFNYVANNLGLYFSNAVLEHSGVTLDVSVDSGDLSTALSNTLTSTLSYLLASHFFHPYDDQTFGLDSDLVGWLTVLTTSLGELFSRIDTSIYVAPVGNLGGGSVSSKSFTLI